MTIIADVQPVVPRKQQMSASVSISRPLPRRTGSSHQNAKSTQHVIENRNLDPAGRAHSVVNADLHGLLSSSNAAPTASAPPITAGTNTEYEELKRKAEVYEQVSGLSIGRTLLTAFAAPERNRGRQATDQGS